MAWMTVTHSCGHEMDYNISGRPMERERRAFGLSQRLCPDCQEKADREQEKELGLPDLEGSDKQIKWARDIRLCFFNTAEHELSDNFYRPRSKEKTDAKIREAEGWLRLMTSSRWWIDHRDDTMEETVEKALEAMRREELDNSPAALQAKADLITMEPEEKATETVCEVESREDTVYVSSEKDDVVRATLKANGFKWDPERVKWYRKCNQMTGAPLDRAKSIANALIRAGVRVRVRPEWVEDISTASFEPEWKRCVYIKISDPDNFFLKYPEDRDIDKALWGMEGRSIRGGFKAPNRAWREIEEFAEFNGFRISDGAKKRIDALKAATVRVTPAAPQEPEVETKDVKDILKSSRDILDDLKDED